MPEKDLKCFRDITRETKKYPNFYLNIQNIFLKNLEFYLKPESITENSKKKRISKYQKHI